VSWIFDLSLSFIALVANLALPVTVNPVLLALIQAVIVLWKLGHGPTVKNLSGILKHSWNARLIE
jgi:hypothetical protein